MDAKGINQQPKVVVTHQVFVISKRLQDGKVLLVKQREACHCSDKKLEQYRKENRLLLVDVNAQRVVVKKGECADFFKERGIEKIEFKPPKTPDLESRGAIHITTVDELSEEEFHQLMETSLKEASEQLEKGKKVLEGFAHQCGCKATPSLRDFIRQYLRQHPEQTVSEVVTRMLQAWNSAAKEDREQAKIADDKHQRLVEDLIRRRLLDTVIKDGIEKTEITKSFGISS